MTDKNDVRSWLQFTIRLVMLIVVLGGGLAVLYARLCVVETKVETALERLARLETKMDRQNKKAAATGIAEVR